MSRHGYARVPDVVWRVGTDRVLVHRVRPANGLADAADLLGLAALIWAVLDEPGDVADICARLGDHPPDDAMIDQAAVRTTLDELAEAGWVTGPD